MTRELSRCSTTLKGLNNMDAEYAFIARPHKGVNNIEFGMSPDEVDGAVGIKGKRFQEGPNCPASEYEQFFVYYDEADRCSEIEFFDGAKILYEGVWLLNPDYDVLEGQLRKLDPDLEVDDDGIMSIKLGVSIWAPFEDDEETVREVTSAVLFADWVYD